MKIKKIPKKELSPYDKIKKLENGIRKIIESELSHISKQWWKQRIPDQVPKPHTKLTLPAA